MSLHIQYSKQIAAALGKVAVYLPGEQIKVGDIVNFPNAEGLFSTAPFGAFVKVTDLERLGVNLQVESDIDSPDPYQLSSNHAVNMNTSLSGAADLETPALPGGEGTIVLSFSKQGAIFFYALDCTKESLVSIHDLEKEIEDGGKSLLWKNTFLVTSVTVARKALVIQSISESAEVEIGGKMTGINTGNLQIAAEAGLTVNKVVGDVFVKDWSDDVTVFIDVMRFKKKVFRKQKTMFQQGISSTEPVGAIVLESVDLSVYL